MKTIFTNGHSLFTLENYDATSSISHANHITRHSEVSNLKARAMHERGTLHYIYGIGDRKELAGVKLNRHMKLSNFKIA